MFIMLKAWLSENEYSLTSTDYTEVLVFMFNFRHGAYTVADDMNDVPVEQLEWSMAFWIMNDDLTVSGQGTDRLPQCWQPVGYVHGI